MKIRNAIKKVGRGVAMVVPASALALAANMAHAAIDISADTTAAKTDISTAGALIIGVVVAVAAVAWVRRVIH
jgi:hypothetical protein